MNNYYNDKKGQYEIPLLTLEGVDRAVRDYFHKKLDISVDEEGNRKKVNVVFATGERWKINKDGLHDENGIVILPVMSIRRANIDRTVGVLAAVREVPYINVSVSTHKKTSLIENQVYQRRNQNFPQKKIIPVQEYFSIPFPDFCTIFYEITIWTQYQTHMNEILEKILYNYDYQDSFVLHTQYDDKKKGSGYRLVAYRDGNITPQDNFQDLSLQERLIKYVYTIRVPTALILDPKDETLSYGRKMGEKRTDNNSKIVLKQQNVVDIKIKEDTISAEVMEAISAPSITEEERRTFFNVLNQTGGSTSSPTLDTATPQPIALVGSAGSSGRLNHSDHVHAHGNLAGGSLHDLVSLTGSGFAPTLSGVTDGYALLKTGSSASWGVVASGGGDVTGSTNFFVTDVLKVSGSIVNTIGPLILSSAFGTRISGTLLVSNNLSASNAYASNLMHTPRSKLWRWP
jgi:hypothetical protein